MSSLNDTAHHYRPADHYWIVAGDETRRWSSAASAYVPQENAGYLAWLAAGGLPARIASEAELDAVLIASGHGDRAPHPPKRMVLKSLIGARLIATGKIDAAKAALEANPAAWARWVAPDQPAIHHDDPDALALLAAIGADAPAIMAE